MNLDTMNAFFDVVGVIQRAKGIKTRSGSDATIVSCAWLGGSYDFFVTGDRVKMIPAIGTACRIKGTLTIVSVQEGEYTNEYMRPQINTIEAVK